MHSYASVHSGKLPGYIDVNRINLDGAIFSNLVEYISAAKPIHPTVPVNGVIPIDALEKMFPRQAVYISPGDPTIDFTTYEANGPPIALPENPTFPGVPELPGLRQDLNAKPLPDSQYPSSYVANATAFTGPPSLQSSFRDGTSNTISFAERYFACVRHFPTEPLKGGASTIPYPMEAFVSDMEEAERTSRRATFADVGWFDVFPVTANGVTRPSVPGVTFGLRPRLGECDYRAPSTAFRAGLPVAMFDGSVRVIARGVSEAAFWGAVTPAGGEVASLD